MNRPSRITSAHLERLAVVYIRQSTPQQVLKNRESQHRQYGLAARAREMGWPDERVLIIDADLGQSAATPGGPRSGFGHLCEQVSRGRVGAVFGIEVSRLARNTVEWFQLLDLCRLNDTILIEDSQVYAPGRNDDDLILGILCRVRHRMPKLTEAVWNDHKNHSRHRPEQGKSDIRRRHAASPRYVRAGTAPVAPDILSAMKTPPVI